MKGEQRFENGISVQYCFHPKKNRKGESDIYVRFHFFQKGIRLDEVLIGIGVSCKPERWDGGRISGKATNTDTQLLNDKLDRITIEVKDGLSELKRLKTHSLPSILNEVKNGLRIKITNKAPS